VRLDNPDITTKINQSDTQNIKKSTSEAYKVWVTCHGEKSHQKFSLHLTNNLNYKKTSPEFLPSEQTNKKSILQQTKLILLLQMLQNGQLHL
jgi:Zn-dependent M32 family carboxypeptidase